jgi:hypothetical protein
MQKMDRYLRQIVSLKIGENGRKSDHNIGPQVSPYIHQKIGKIISLTIFEKWPKCSEASETSHLQRMTTYTLIISTTKKKFSREQATLPDFYLFSIPKREKYTKWPQNVPNGHRINHLAVK